MTSKTADHDIKREVALLLHRKDLKTLSSGEMARGEEWLANMPLPKLHLWDTG